MRGQHKNLSKKITLTEKKQGPDPDIVHKYLFYCDYCQKILDNLSKNGIPSSEYKQFALHVETCNKCQKYARDKAYDLALLGIMF